MTYLQLTDPDYELLQDIFRTLDHAWNTTWAAAEKYRSPGDEPFMDRIEYIAGIGLAACQQYINSKYPLSEIKRPAAISLPPKHPSGPSYAALVDAGANFWKHSDEWAIEPESKRRRTLEILRTALSEDEMGFLCSNLLCVLVGKESSPFSRLQEKIFEWRSELEKQ